MEVARRPVPMPRTSFEMTSRVAPIALAFAQSRGLDPKALIAAHQLPADLDWRQAGKIELTLPANRLKALLDDVGEKLSLPHLGLELAKALPKGSYGVAEFLIRSVPTVRGLLENLVRFNSLLAPHQVFRFEETETEAQLHHGVPGSPDAMSVHHHEYTTLVLVTTFLGMVDGASINRVWFANPKLAEPGPLSAAFGTSALSFTRSSRPNRTHLCVATICFQNAPKRMSCQGTGSETWTPKKTGKWRWPCGKPSPKS
jgi:hypothetical protein